VHLKQVSSASSGSKRFTKVINDTVDDAYVVLALNGAGHVKEVGVHRIDGDAKPERRGNGVFSAATKFPGGVMNMACAEPARSVLKRPGNPCPAQEYVGVRAERLASPKRNCGAHQVAEHVCAVPSVRDVRSGCVTEIQFGSNAFAAVRGKVNVESTQGDAACRRR